MPFDATRVIPADWSSHHRQAATGGMNATVDIAEQTGSTYDPQTDDTVAVWTSRYAGPARIQATNQPRQVGEAAQQLAGQTYLVQIDIDTPARLATAYEPGLRARVITCANDPTLVLRDLWVVAVPGGSELFTRDLICSDDQADVPA